MTDLLLAKPRLNEGETDLSVGESNLIRYNLFRNFPQLINNNKLSLNNELSTNDLEYPNPAGYGPLVELLEKKYDAPVVITNGAKQAIAAAFYALKKRSFGGVGLQPIHWALLPPLAKSRGLGISFREPTDKVAHSMAYLLLAPNNPNGWCSDLKDLKALHKSFTEAGSPLIHDAAYYTHSYLPKDYELGRIGDMQIYSCSKMFGFSGVRVGYIVCYNKDYYKDLVEYVEMETVGVSIFAQKFVYDTFVEFEKHKDSAEKFEAANRQDLQEAKNILKKVSDKILGVPPNIDKVAGLFAWCKLKNKNAFDKAKIHIVGGEHFGDKSMVRLNLGIGNDVLKKCVDKLNEIVK